MKLGLRPEGHVYDLSSGRENVGDLASPRRCTRPDPPVAFAVWNSGYRQGRTGQSIGRRVTKTKLVKIETGEPIGFGMALLRQIFLVVTLLYPMGVVGFLGQLRSLWDPKRQTGADKIFKVVVIHIDDAPEERRGTRPRRR